MLYRRGAVIISCQPLAHTLNNDQKSFRCDHCFLANDSLRKCSQCRQMYYCGVHCQRSDWKVAHKLECLHYQNFNSKLEDCDRFLLRLWLTTKSGDNLKSKLFRLHTGGDRCLNDLMSHCVDVISDQKRYNYFKTICRRFREANVEFDSETLFQLFGIVCVNSFSILNTDLNAIGTGLYVCASIFNHSCQPNAAPVFDGINLQIRAIRDISDSEEALINYIDIKVGKSERQLRLRQQYYFDCHCVKCETDFDRDIDYPLVNSLNKQLDELVDETNEWQNCYSLCLQTISIYKQIYGEFHPDLTVQLVRLLKLKALLCDDIRNESVVQLLKDVNQCIQITHGVEHNLANIVREIIGIQLK